MFIDTFSIIPAVALCTLFIWILTRYEKILRPAHDAHAIATLAHLREGIEILSLDRGYPDSIDALKKLILIYLHQYRVPYIKLGPHRTSNQIKTTLDDRGGWCFDLKSKELRLNCVHQDQTGVRYSDY